MFKKIFLWGLSAGILSAAASLIYNRIYFFATEADFSKIVNTGSIIGTCIGSCILASAGFWALQKWLKHKGEIIFNFIFTILSFASVMGPIAGKLPLDIAFPELFPGLAVPMHFFPALAWYTLRPVFRKDAVLQ